MRTPSESKAATGARACEACGQAVSTPKQCPTCARPTSPRACRPVRGGWYCHGAGFQPDPAQLVTSEPDPWVVQALADPHVHELRAAADVKRIAYEEAARAWSEAVGELAAFERDWDRRADASVLAGEPARMPKDVRAEWDRLSAKVGYAKAVRDELATAEREAARIASGAFERALHTAKAEAAGAEAAARAAEQATRTAKRRRLLGLRAAS